MRLFRTFLHDQRQLAALLVALALCMKALVPAGYMIAPQMKLLTLEVCADSSGGHVVKHIAVPLNSKPGESQGEHAKAESACPWSALAMGALGGADAPLLASALAFILALG